MHLHQFKERKKKKTNKWLFAVYVGFFAGVFWGGIKMLEHYFHFTSLSPGFLLDPFFQRSFLMSLTGYLMGYGAFIGFSIAAAVIYALLFSKIKGPWLGLGYGAGWWGALYLLVGPITGMMDWILYMDLNTILTDATLFMVWGLFIGYSIAFEFTDERVREPLRSSRRGPQPG